MRRELKPSTREAYNTARWYIQFYVAFFKTVFKIPMKDDWVKLKILLKYVCGIVQLPIILCVNKLNIINWYVGECFTTLRDVRYTQGEAL